MDDNKKTPDQDFREVTPESSDDTEIKNIFSMGVMENFFKTAKCNYHEYMWMIKAEFEDNSFYESERVYGYEDDDGEKLIFDWIDIDKDGHQTIVALPAVAATCTKDGKKVDKCSVCGDTKETKINKVDHEYGDPVVSKNTQGKDVKTQTCKYGCGETKITMSLADGGFERESSGKVQKGTKGTWLVPVAEEKPGASLKFIVSLSSDSHTDRSFYTNHEGASSSDSFESNAENDGKRFLPFVKKQECLGAVVVVLFFHFE